MSHHVVQTVTAGGMNTEHVQDDIKENEGASSSSTVRPDAPVGTPAARAARRAVVVPEPLEEALVTTFGEKWRDAMHMTHCIYWAAPIVYCHKCGLYAGNQKSLHRGDLSKVCGEHPPNAYRKQRILDRKHPDNRPPHKDVVLGHPQRIF